MALPPRLLPTPTLLALRRQVRCARADERW
eukprot:COSAG06_NODE_41709_length_388_cov_1.249135_1_plen_29_part_10